LDNRSKKSFAIIAIVVGVVGVGIGAYTIVTAGSTLVQNESNESSPLFGSRDAPVTIVEYGDYQCPNCQRFATQVKPLIIENYVSSGKVNLIFRDFPIYGDDSVNGAMAAHCAGEQNLFWEMHDLMYQNQKAVNSGWLSSDNIKQLASDAYLDMQQFNPCFDGRKYANKILENFNVAKADGVNGTPTFMIIDNNGLTMTLRGAQPFDTFKQVLDDMLES
jgi:protein-disulfide isomerase